MTLVLKNYPDFILSPAHKTEFFGFYQRPYGLAGIHSGSASILTALLAWQYWNRHLFSRELTRYLQVFGALAVLLTISGTSYLVYCIYLTFVFYRPKNMVRTSIAAIAIASIPFVLEVLHNYFHHEIFRRFALSYILWLLDYKMQQLTVMFDPFSLRGFELFFGSDYSTVRELPLYTDAGWTPYLYTYGLGGILVFLLIFIPNVRRGNALPIALLVVSNFHYPSIFTTLGAIVMAALLVEKRVSAVAPRRLSGPSYFARPEQPSVV